MWVSAQNSKSTINPSSVTDYNKIGTVLPFGLLQCIQISVLSKQLELISIRKLKCSHSVAILWNGTFLCKVHSNESGFLSSKQSDSFKDKTWRTPRLEVQYSTSPNCSGVTKSRSSYVSSGTGALILDRWHPSNPSNQGSADETLEPCHITAFMWPSSSSVKGVPP